MSKETEHLKAELARYQQALGQMHMDLYGMQDGSLMRDLQGALIIAQRENEKMRARISELESRK